MRVGCWQAPFGTDARENLDRLSAALTRAAARDIDILCLPELAFYPWFPQYRPEACDLVWKTEYMLDVMRESGRRAGIDLVTTMLTTTSDGTAHNTGIWISAGGEIVGKYEKSYLPATSPFLETDWYRPGKGDFTTFRSGGVRGGILICSDVMFSELARLLKTRGAQILFVPRAVLAGAERRWRVMLRAAAVTSGCYVVSANRVGLEDRVHFGGGSTIVEPGGLNYIEADGESEDLIGCEFDASLVKKAQNRYPCTLDTRWDLYPAGGEPEDGLGG